MVAVKTRCQTTFVLEDISLSEVMVGVLPVADELLDHVPEEALR